MINKSIFFGLKFLSDSRIQVCNRIYEIFTLNLNGDTEYYISTFRNELFPLSLENLLNVERKFYDKNEKRIKAKEIFQISDIAKLYQHIYREQVLRPVIFKEEDNIILYAAPQFSLGDNLENYKCDFSKLSQFYIENKDYIIYINFDNYQFEIIDIFDKDGEKLELEAIFDFSLDDVSDAVERYRKQFNIEEYVEYLSCSSPYTFIGQEEALNRIKAVCPICNSLLKIDFSSNPMLLDNLKCDRCGQILSFGVDPKYKNETGLFQLYKSMAHHVSLNGIFEKDVYEHILQDVFTNKYDAVKKIRSSIYLIANEFKVKTY